MAIPNQYNRVMPYLVIPNAYKFIDFMTQVFGAKEELVVPRTEGVIMHGELRIGDSVIMFADTTDEISARPAGMFIYVDDLDEVYKKALAAGAVSTIEPTQQSYGYTCGLKDPFGNDWWPVEIPADK
jgi:PhnB protein